MYKDLKRMRIAIVLLIKPRRRHRRGLLKLPIVIVRGADRAVWVRALAGNIALCSQG